jgi:hypothetical protein
VVILHVFFLLIKIFKGGLLTILNDLIYFTTMYEGNLINDSYTISDFGTNDLLDYAFKNNLSEEDKEWFSNLSYRDYYRYNYSNELKKLNSDYKIPNGKYISSNDIIELLFNPRLGGIKSCKIIK